MLTSFQRATVAVALLAFLSAATPATVQAGMIGTPAAVESAQRAAHLAQVDSVLARADVQQQLEALGVDPLAARDRAAALTNAELADFASQLENAPAGGDALAVIGIVFLVLLILEVVGVIDIFKKT